MPWNAPGWDHNRWRPGRSWWTQRPVRASFIGSTTLFPCCRNPIGCSFRWRRLKSCSAGELWVTTCEGGGVRGSVAAKGESMGGMIPLGDASRRPSRWPIITVLLIAVNVYVFTRELMYGEAFVYQWSVIPAEIRSEERRVGKEGRSRW